MHQNRVQNIIQYHDNCFENRCVLKNYVIVLRPIFYTTYKGEIQVDIFMRALHHKLVLFQQISTIWVGLELELQCTASAKVISQRGFIF